MKIADITALYKGKGSMSDLKNERRTFLVTTYRLIIMKQLSHMDIKWYDK